MEVSRLAIDKRVRRRGYVLLALTVVSYFVVGVVGQTVFPAYVFEDMVVWFWIGNVIAAALTATGILLSYWWSLEDIPKRKERFAYLCIFILFFFFGAGSGLIQENSAGGSISLYLGAKPPACELEAEVCMKFVGTNDESKRQRLADIFYPKTGINLLAVTGPGEAGKPPSDKADVMRREWQQIEADHFRGKSFVERRGAAARYVMGVYLGVAILMFGGGGLVLGRRAPAA